MPAMVIPDSDIEKLHSFTGDLLRSAASRAGLAPARPTGADSEREEGDSNQGRPHAKHLRLLESHLLGLRKSRVENSAEWLRKGLELLALPEPVDEKDLEQRREAAAESLQAAEEKAIDTLSLAPTFWDKICVAEIAISAAAYHYNGLQGNSELMGQRLAACLNKLLRQPEIQRLVSEEQSKGKWGSWMRPSTTSRAKRSAALAEITSLTQKVGHFLRQCGTDYVVPCVMNSSGSSSVPSQIWPCVNTVRGHTGSVVALATQGGYFYSAGADGAIRVWDTECPRKISEYSMKNLHSDGSVTTLAADENRLFTGGSRRTVCIWDAQRMAKLGEIGGGAGPVTAAAVHGQRLLIGGMDKNVQIFDLRSQRKTGDLAGSCGSVFALATLGNFVFAGGSDHAIEVWDGSRSVGALPGLNGVVRALAAIGSRVFAASDEGVVKVWDTKRMEEVAALEIRDRRVLALASQGDLLFSGDDQGLVQVWEASCPPPDAESRARMSRMSSLFSGVGPTQASHIGPTPSTARENCSGGMGFPPAPPRIVRVSL